MHIVTGVGSTLATTGTLMIGNGSSATVSAGGEINTGSATASVGTGGRGTLLVEGNGSKLTAGSLVLGQNGSTGMATFRNGSTGAFNMLAVDPSGNASSLGTLHIETGARVNANSLTLAVPTSRIPES